MHDVPFPAWRMANQRLAGPGFTAPTDAVRFLGAVQSQDVAGAYWAIGQRTPGTTGADIAAAFDAGAFLRTHVLRPTWHFVAPADIRWLLELTAPRVHQLNGTMYRQNGVNDETIAISRRVLEAGLQGGRSLTRNEIGALFAEAGLAGKGFQAIYLLMHAELEGLICSGPVRGKQQTYALLEERVSPASTLDRDGALAALATRFATSHGPVAARDLAWWASLTLADARRAFELAEPNLERLEIAGESRWFAPGPVVGLIGAPVIRLLPNYDELFSLHPESRGAMGLQPGNAGEVATAGRMDHHHLVIDGCLAGGWQRTLTARKVSIEVDPFRALAPEESAAVVIEAKRYAAFVGREPAITWSGA